MALDKDGRPIPVSIPEPLPAPIPGQQEEQAVLMSKKVDAALKDTASLAERVNAIEQTVFDTVNKKIAEMQNRVDEMLLAKLRDVQQQIDHYIKEQVDKPPPIPELIAPIKPPLEGPKE